MRPRVAAMAAMGAALALTACPPAGPPRMEPVAGLPAAEPPVRVGIAVNEPEITLSATGVYELVAPDGRTLAMSTGDERWIFTARGGAVQASTPDGARVVGPLDHAVVVRPRDGTRLRIGDRPYRGEASIFAAGPETVTAVNVVEMEAYLLGVVPAEIPSLELEAVKAQAVAARTYAVGHLRRREALGFDVFASVADQVYGGLEGEDPMAERAVRETRGEILVHRGSPIMAYYHSTCGGQTAALEEVWPGAPVPYLRSVSDRIRGTDRFYCDSSSRFRWTERWLGRELAALLTRSLEPHVGGEMEPIRSVRDLVVTGRTPSARAAGLRIEADGRGWTVTGDSIRWVLRPDDARGLNSTFFSLGMRREGDTIQVVEAHGGGWGHGIGMCQMGAIGRAGAGQSYREILRTYYRGTNLVRLY